MDFSSLNVRRWLILAFTVLCIVLNTVVYVLYKKNADVNDSKQWVTHTYQVINNINELFSNLEDAQVAQRGYLITGQERFLAPYHTAVENTESLYDGLKKLTADNHTRDSEWPALQSLFVQQFSLMEKQIATKRTEHTVDSHDMDTNKELMDKSRALISDIRQDEQRLLKVRSDAEAHKQANYLQTIFFSAGISLIGLLIANGAILFLSLRRRLAEQSLIRINKEMEGFTYIASHDLRSPLVNLKGFASEMRTGITELKPLIEKALPTLSAEEQKKLREILDSDIPDALHYIHSSVEKMDKLTNAILELSRLGRRNLNLELVNAHKVARHCLDTLHHQIESQHIDIELHPLPNVMVDALSLEQVFGNIIDNAIKYLDPSRPGRIEIGGSRNYRETIFWVKDNGRGVSAADNQKIFEIYRRAGNTDNIPGEGMGMAYVRTTLRRLGGTIWCESQPGIGSVFYFSISNNLKKESPNE